MRRTGGCAGGVRTPAVRVSALVTALILGLGTGSWGCAGSSDAAADGRPRVVVTYSVAAAVVADLVGTAAWVEVLIPDGTDPHEWRASAKDLESLRRATVIVDNGLGLEASLADAIEQASASGVIRFSLADHVKVRTVGDEDAAGHENHAETADGSDDGSDGGSDGGVRDPHLWTDPVTMRQWVAPLAELLGRHGIDVQANVAPLQAQLDRLDAEVAALIDAIPPPQRRLVTGHESLGYFAQRYGLELIGAVIPSFSSQAGAAAGALADLVAKTEQAGVRSIFAEAGTPAATIDAVAQDAGVTVVALSTHALPPDRTYAGFVRNLAVTISGALT